MTVLMLLQGCEEPSPLQRPPDARQLPLRGPAGRSHYYYAAGVDLSGDDGDCGDSAAHYYCRGGRWPHGCTWDSMSTTTTIWPRSTPLTLILLTYVLLWRWDQQRMMDDINNDRVVAAVVQFEDPWWWWLGGWYRWRFRPSRIIITWRAGAGAAGGRPPSVFALPVGRAQVGTAH